MPNVMRMKALLCSFALHNHVCDMMNIGNITSIFNEQYKLNETFRNEI